MTLTYDYIHQSRGYRVGVGCCWVRIYMGEPGDSPVILCSDLPREQYFEISENAGCLAAEVIKECFPESLPNLPRPLLWIEHHPARRHGPGKFYLLTFPNYRPRPANAGFIRRFTIGTPVREPLTPEEVEILTGERIR